MSVDGIKALWAFKFGMLIGLIAGFSVSLTVFGIWFFGHIVLQ